MVYNKNNMNLKSGYIEVATNWDGTTFADGDGTNEAAILAQLEALTFKNLGLFKDFQFVHSLEDEKIINSDACGVGEVDRSIVLTPRAEFTRQEVDNLEEIARMYGLSLVNVTATPVAITDEALGADLSAGAIVKLVNKSFSWTGAALVASVTVSDTGGALVEGTDYELSLDDDGKTQVVFLLATTGATTIDYTYTPMASQLSTYKVQSRSLPYNLLRFVECPEGLTGNGEYNVYYLVKYAISSEFTQQMVNTKITDFEGAAVTLTGADGGNFFEKKGRITEVTA